MLVETSIRSHKMCVLLKGNDVFGIILSIKIKLKSHHNSYDWTCVLQYGTETAQRLPSAAGHVVFVAKYCILTWSPF